MRVWRLFRERARTRVVRACSVVLLMTGQYEKVETLATTYLKDPPESGDWQFYLGKAFVLRGKHEEAKSAFGKAARSGSPLAIDAEMQLALLLKNLGDFNQSRELFSKVYDRSSSAGDRLGLAAQALHHLEQYKESNRLFKQVTEQNAKDFETWVAWGNLFLEKYNPADAASVFADVLEVESQAPGGAPGLALCRGEGTGEEVEKILGESAGSQSEPRSGSRRESAVCPAG